MTTFFGFGIAPSMFPTDCTIRRESMTPDEVRGAVRHGATPCLNPSHAETIRVMRTRFGIDVPIPDKAPVVNLKPGDAVIVMGVTGLPRLEGRHEYTATEIDNAVFTFSRFSVVA